MKKTLLITAALALVLAPAIHAGGGAAQKAAEAAAAGLSMDHNAAGRQGFSALPNARFSGGRSSLVAGTIQYDSGAVGTAGQSSFCVGNQFDTTGGANPLTASGSVTQIQVSMVGVGGTGAFFSIFHQQAGATANVISSSFISSITPGMNTVGVGPFNYVGSTFLAGMWQFTVGSDTPAVASGTTGGQGFHGMSINDVVGTGFNRPGTFNAVMRPSGNLLAIPVELTGFEIVEDGR